MFHYGEVTGYADSERGLTIDLPSPDGEGGGTALLLVERIDGVEGDFTITPDGLIGESFGAVARRTQLVLGSVVDGASRIWARVHSQAPGWFRARIVWIKNSLPKAPCILCRQALATLVAAGFAVAGVPMPDLALDEVAPELLDSVYAALHTPPLKGFLRQIHPDLPDIIESVIRGVDLLRTLLSQIYNQCCIRLGLC